jgi:hypothetical protein
VSNPISLDKPIFLTLLLAMDWTPNDESENTDQDYQDTDDLETAPSLSSDTFEAEIDFVSSEDYLAAPSTTDSSTEEHEEHFSRGEADEDQQEIMTTPTVPSRWLGTGRTPAEAQGMVVAIKKEDHSSLTADYLLKLQKKTVEGMELSFSLMTHASEDQLEECYNLGLRIEVLKT